MYRSRVGLDLIPNQYLKERAVEWHRKIHKENMDRIKKRKKGTGTVDTTCPESAKASREWIVNGRARFMKKDRYRTIAKENKALLQRMTRVMTTGTDLFDNSAAAQQQHPGLSKNKHNEAARKHRQAMISHKNKQLLHTLETIKPVYNVEKWEEERIAQEAVLKWMAKVHYKPKNKKETLEQFRNREYPKLVQELDGGKSSTNAAAAAGSQPESSELIDLDLDLDPLKAAPTKEVGDAKEPSQKANNHKKRTAARPSSSSAASPSSSIAAAAATGRKRSSSATTPNVHAASTARSTTPAAAGGGKNASQHLKKTSSSRQHSADAQLATTIPQGGLPRRLSSRSGSGTFGRIRDAQEAAGTLTNQIHDDKSISNLGGSDQGSNAAFKPPSFISNETLSLASTLSLGTVKDVEEIVSHTTHDLPLKKADGNEPQVKVEVIFLILPDAEGLKLCVKTLDEESPDQSFSTESTLTLDEARTILSSSQKKSGPLSEAELVLMINGLLDSIELIESPCGAVSIIFRKKMDFRDEDQFFSMVNKNLTALQQLYMDQRKEVKRSSINFLGSNGGNILVEETRSIPLFDPAASLNTSSSQSLKVHFVANEPICGEVTITARIEPCVLIQDGTPLTFKSRVPTLVLANRLQAIEYVTKMISKMTVVKNSNDLLHPYKLEVQTQSTG